MNSSTYKNIALLMTAVIFMIAAWAAVQMMRGNAVIDKASSPAVAIKKGHADARSDFSAGLHYFKKSWVKGLGFTISGLNTENLSGKLAEAARREYHWGWCGSYGWSDSSIEHYKIHESRYLDYEIYNIAFNGKMAELIRATESFND
jgi:hypothetical protein